jgi:hexosaminidase
MESKNHAKTLIPKPISVVFSTGVFQLKPGIRIAVEPGNPEVMAIGRYLADSLAVPTGFSLPVVEMEQAPAGSQITLQIDPDATDLGEEGYSLSVTPLGILLKALQPKGLFWGLQTLRQLLPPAIEADKVQDGPWEIEAVEIRDMPRFPFRGLMLDVSRHFFGPAEVRRLLDLMTLYKLNMLHLGLTNDQGWRLMIESWPNLALVGGNTQVGGGPGGYYTQQEYAGIVDYAQRRGITVIPEINVPGHTNAALVAYPELNCDGIAPEPFTGTGIHTSSLCVGKEVTYTFLEDVIGEVAALTPGPYLHCGGDEAEATSEADYLQFMARIQEIVAGQGKRLIGWDEIGISELQPSTVVQFWRPGQMKLNLPQGVKVIFSPAWHIYLDMKYNPETSLGLDWAGSVSVRDAYNWDPVGMLDDVTEVDILGLEAPLWTETVETLDDIEYMTFPRAIGAAEIGWSAREGRDWQDYCLRIAAHGPRLDTLQVKYYRSPLVPWD